MSTARKILSNTAFQMAGRLTVAVMGIITVKLITNYLTKAEYGSYSVVYDFLAMFGIMADFGLFTIGVREMAANEGKIQRIIGNIIGIRFALAIAVLLIAIFAGSMVYAGDSQKIYGIMIGATATFIALIQGTVASVLQVRLKMMYVSLFQVLGKLAQVSYIYFVIQYLFSTNTSGGFFHLLLAGVIANSVMLLGCLYYANKETPIRLYFDFDYWKEMVCKALPYGFALALATIYLRVDSFMLSKLRGDQDVAYYAVAVRILEAFRILPLYFMNSTLPSLTRSLANKDQKHQTIIQYSIEFMAALSLPVLVGGVLLAYNIIGLVSSESYLSNYAVGFYGSDSVLQILLFELIFSFLNAIFVFTLIAMHQQAKTIWINGGAALLNVVLNLMLIPVLGFHGAGITTVFSEAFVLFVAFLMVQRHLKLTISFKNIFKILFSAGLMGVVVYGGRTLLNSWLSQGIIFPNTELSFSQENLLIVAILVPLGAIVYGVLLFFTKAVTPQMLRLLRKSDSEKEVVG